jgi:hypothetical protein
LKYQQRQPSKNNNLWSLPILKAGPDDVRVDLARPATLNSEEIEH